MGVHEMDELTRRGLPGVWLHGFWDAGILRSTNPMWKMNTPGLYALVMNAVMEMAGGPR